MVIKEQYWWRRCRAGLILDETSVNLAVDGLGEFTLPEFIK